MSCLWQAWSYAPLPRPSSNRLPASTTVGGVPQYSDHTVTTVARAAARRCVRPEASDALERHRRQRHLVRHARAALVLRRRVVRRADDRHPQQVARQSDARNRPSTAAAPPFASVRPHPACTLRPFGWRCQAELKCAAAAEWSVARCCRVAFARAQRSRALQANCRPAAQCRGMQELSWSINQCIDPNCEGFYFQEVMAAAGSGAWSTDRACCCSGQPRRTYLPC